MNNDNWVDIILVAAGPLRHRKLRTLVTEILGAVHEGGAEEGIRSARAVVSSEIYECLDRGEECRPLLRVLERLGHLLPEDLTVPAEADELRSATFGRHGADSVV